MNFILCFTFLLWMTASTDAEMMLLKHVNDLYCISDDVDAPALGWIHNLRSNTAQPEQALWLPLPSVNQGIDCYLGNTRTGDCNAWNKNGWSTVKSYLRALPSVLDHRWNEFVRHIVPKGKPQTALERQASYQNVNASSWYLSLSLLVYESAIMYVNGKPNEAILEIDLDGWINDNKPRRELQECHGDPSIWSNCQMLNAEGGCTNCDGLILGYGQHWTTVTLSYQENDLGTTITMDNDHDNLINTWSLARHLNLSTFSSWQILEHESTVATFGVWRVHDYDVLLPTRDTDDAILSVDFIAKTNFICISLTYYAPLPQSVYQQSAFIELVARKQVVNQNTLASTGNSWRTARHVFNITRGTTYTLRVVLLSTRLPDSLIIGQVRECSQNEVRMSKLQNNVGAECMELKHKTSISVSDITPDKPSIFSCPSGYFGENCNIRCSEIIAGANDCRGVIACTTTHQCSCLPGYSGPKCDQGLYQSTQTPPITNQNQSQISCKAGTFGPGCKSVCHCKESAKCDQLTGKCPNECASGWSGEACNTESTSTLMLVLYILGGILIIAALGLLCCFSWNLRLKRKKRKEIMMIKALNRPLPNPIDRNIKNVRYSANPGMHASTSRPDSEIYDEIIEDSGHEMFQKNVPNNKFTLDTAGYLSMDRNASLGSTGSSKTETPSTSKLPGIEMKNLDSEISTDGYLEMSSRVGRSRNVSPESTKMSGNSKSTRIATPFVDVKTQVELLENAKHVEGKKPLIEYDNLPKGKK